ncbi:hypothetical protein FHA84_22715 [Salmonella enterica subsp. enterica]|uniref:XRE family transcriptional regulator n=1 Tax=Salmonella enterica subsp. enterica serovar Panama TaxID=29472 RepID=A0A619AFU7_SALET|nr:hypothetical protein [Salmonella enterica]EBA1164489.1 hypothetical protein [Salmonella enterica subsp. enterica]EBF8622397.1 hypothetical protein [Salmonella enterica subsp. enterica serovar Istanbul]EBS4563066.1 hypothetical protein [Salmonella enterica subsp. enterica serovar Bovismorbificans]EBU7264665.1 hypothetical protein [Salmonella enterica subsp. enterica serovar Oranienburg]ECM8329246.1 hypothetical protein [Salmonella enterica subsp. enterica serovar Tennessee]ECN6755356.1 hypo
MTTKNRQMLSNDWGLSAMERLLREKKRLGISDERMAELLGLDAYFYYLVSDEKPDFRVYELSERVQIELLRAGVDLFYVMTGESRDSSDALKWHAFNYAISDLPPEKQQELFQVIGDVPKGFMN